MQAFKAPKLESKDLSESLVPEVETDNSCLSASLGVPSLPKFLEYISVLQTFS